MTEKPLLLPRPRHCELLGGSCRVPAHPVVHSEYRDLALAILGDAVVVGLDAWIRCQLEDGHGEEGYRLEVDADGVRILATTREGLRWGMATLAQLRYQYGCELPRLEIDDAPLFRHRGVMLDISRDRVPTTASLHKLVDQLVGWKINHLQLYIEHTFAYVGHEAVWRGSSPILPSEMRMLDEYCRQRGISLAANQNCLGHFERWLKLPAYAHLGECSGPQMASGGTRYRDPNTLCPLDPRALDLVRDLLGQIMPCCSSEFVNIGCDEPWDLGTGRSRTECERIGKAQVFSHYVTQVAEAVAASGKKPQFWVDPHPNEDDSLTEGLTALVWGYHGDFDFRPNASAHREAGRQVWLCPGTGSWTSFTGRTSERRCNLNRAMEASELAEGLLTTCWGDKGHRQQWPIDVVGMADGAQAAWSGSDFDDEALGLQAFGVRGLGPWLIRFGNADLELSRIQAGDQMLRNASFSEMEANLFIKPSSPDSGEDWERFQGVLGELECSLPAETDPLLQRELRHALECARIGAERAVERRRPGGPLEDRRKAIAARIADLIGEHRALWLRRSRPGGIEDSSQHYRILAERW